jgi:acetylornithine deacetylase/succinyl-diaminopimelate desuccinylase-like protein
MVINDPDIEIETIMAFTPAISSTENEVYRVMEAVTRENFPGAAILPSVQSGFTDSHFFRDLGIEAYGYSPDLIPLEDDQGVHGNDERVSVENVRRGVRLMLDTVERIVTPR